MHIMFDLDGMLYSNAKQPNDNCNNVTIDLRCLGLYISSNLNLNLISLPVAMLYDC